MIEVEKQLQQRMCAGALTLENLLPIVRARELTTTEIQATVLDLLFFFTANAALGARLLNDLVRQLSRHWIVM